MKVGMVSLGCPKNQVDAEVMAGMLKAAGHEITAREKEADAIIVNTCAFIRDAAEESIDAILEMASLKDAGKLKHLVITGCLAERYKSGLLKELPEVDAYLGTGEFHRAPEVLAALRRGDLPRAARRTPVPAYIYSHDTPRVTFTPGHWCYLKIAEGCDNRCSYCKIPSLRGRLRSRPGDSICKEAAALAERGVREICLVAQDTTAYGSDLKGGDGLVSLLRRLEDVKGLDWIRLLYAHPARVSDGLMELMAGSEKLLSYLDIPIQHINDDILRRMGRKTGSAGVRSLIDRVREKAPGIALRTSLMVGFPGETREKFLTLLRFLKETEFDHVGVFAFSEEDGTPASGMTGKVSETLAGERRDQLMKAQARISLKKNKARVGRVYKVMVDGPSRESDLLVSGRAYFQAPEVDGVIYITDGAVRPGEFAQVEITGAHTYDLTGRAV